MKVVVAAFNQEKALVGAFYVITNLRMELFQALVSTLTPHPVELEVEAARVADRFPLGVPPPQRGGVGLAVGADHPRPPVAGAGVGHLHLREGFI